MEREAALILGSYRQTVSVVRSLSLAGLRTVVGSDRLRSAARFSRFADESWLHPGIDAASDAFGSALRELLARRREIRWIFPVGEDEIRHFLRSSASLPGSCGVVMPERSVVEACLDKPALYEVARACDVPFAEFGVARDANSLEEWIARIGYPLVVKPTASIAELDGHRALVLSSEAARARLLPRWPAGIEALIVQRHARGLRHNCHFAALEGRLLAYFEQEVLRTNRSDGTRYAVESVSVAPSQALREHTARLVARLGYSGAGCTQFLVQGEGSAMLLELNPRLDANCELARRCGVDFARLALEIERRRRGDPATFLTRLDAYPVGRRCHWAVGDVQGLLHEWRVGEIGWTRALRWLREAIGASLLANVHLVGWLRDPLPALYALAEGIPRRRG